MNINCFCVCVFVTCFAFGVQVNVVVGQDGADKKNKDYWSTMKTSFATVQSKYREMKQLQQNKIDRTRLSWRSTELDMSNHWKDRESVKKAISKSLSKTAREYSIKNQLARALKSKMKNYLSNQFTIAKSKATNQLNATLKKYQAKQQAKAIRTAANKKADSAKSNSANNAVPKDSTLSKRKEFNRYKPKSKSNIAKRPKRPLWKPK